MKNLVLFAFLFFCFAVFSGVIAQAKPDSDLRDNNIRMRSMDLERSKRDAEKNNSASATQMNVEIDRKFAAIKADYEGLQKAQNEIVKAYTTGEKINYKQIEKSAREVNENAARLGSNLFVTEITLEKTKIDDKKEVKNLIVELDEAIGSFVSSAMFQNLRVVDQKVADKAQIDLAKILKISRNLAKESGKMK